jgi:hypothetical protein
LALTQRGALPAQFRTAVQFRLGAVDAMTPVCAFQSCQFGPLDRFGYHITAEHHKTTTHNCVRDAVAHFYREAKISTAIEPAFASIGRSVKEKYYSWKDASAQIKRE